MFHLQYHGLPQAYSTENNRWLVYISAMGNGHSINRTMRWWKMSGTQCVTCTIHTCQTGFQCKWEKGYNIRIIIMNSEYTMCDQTDGIHCLLRHFFTSDLNSSWFKRRNIVVCPCQLFFCFSGYADGSCMSWCHSCNWHWQCTWCFHSPRDVGSDSPDQNQLRGALPYM